MKKIELKVYGFKELSPAAQETAIENEVQYCMEEHDYDLWTPNMRKAVEEADRKRSPELVEDLAYKYCKPEIESRLSNPIYFFLSNGEMFVEDLYPKE